MQSKVSKRLYDFTFFFKRLININISICTILSFSAFTNDGSNNTYYPS